jgi:ADP-dependent phosphofructokinase/glucokinase
VVSTNVLRNATGLTVSNAGLANTIKQGCLAMVNVTHHGHNRSARQNLHIAIVGVGGQEGIGII